MTTEKRLIDANEAYETVIDLSGQADTKSAYVAFWKAGKEIQKLLTVDAYTAEQVENIVQQADKLEARNNELEKECAWLKSCLNCKIRKECPRHCGKVVHDCDHWEYGDNAVEVVHAEWIDIRFDSMWRSMLATCSHCKVRGEVRVKSNECGFAVPDSDYCPHCGAKMDGGINK